jgi:hypothetical protein
MPKPELPCSGHFFRYWKYGCWFFEQKTRGQALIESNWDDTKSEIGAGGLGRGANKQTLL